LLSSIRRERSSIVCVDCNHSKISQYNITTLVNDADFKLFRKKVIFFN
jgi:hypothetical protein